MITLNIPEDKSLSQENQNILYSYLETIFPDIVLDYNLSKDSIVWSINDNSYTATVFNNLNNSKLVISTLMDNNTVSSMSWTSYDLKSESILDSDGPSSPSMIQEIEIKAANTVIDEQPVEPLDDDFDLLAFLSGFNDQDDGIYSISPTDHQSNLATFKTQFYINVTPLLEEFIRPLFKSFNVDKLFADFDEVDYLYLDNFNVIAHLKDDACPNKLFSDLKPHVQTYITNYLLELAAFNKSNL